MESTQSSTAAGPRAYPIAEGCSRIGLKPTKRAELVQNASIPAERMKGNYLDTFLVGRFRYITAEELRRFVEARIQESKDESSATRAGKVAAAVAARAK